VCGSALGGRPHGIRPDPLWPRPRVVQRNPKTHWVLERPRGARRFAPKKGGSAASRRWRGFSTVTRPASQHDKNGSTTCLDKERNGLWPDDDARRRGGAARRLDAGRAAVRRRCSRGQVSVGMLQKRGAYARDTSGANTPRLGLSPLPGRARWDDHGGARPTVTTAGRSKALTTDGVQRRVLGRRREHARGS
jgi:hypothetical protein